MTLDFGPLAPAPSLDLLGPHGLDILPLFNRPFLVMHQASRIYTARTCLLLLMDLEWDRRLRRGVTLDDLCAVAPAQVRKPLAWMLPFLVAEGMLVCLNGRYTLTGEPDLDLKGIREEMERQAPGHQGNFDLLDGVRSHIRPFFTEGKAGEGLLFDLSLFPLWLNFFRNENVCYLPNNLLALLVLQDGLPEGARVLELGGGAGSFAQLVARLGAAEGWLGRIAEYTFTDVAPSFLRRAQRDLKDAAPGLPLRFQTLDLNHPMAGQGIEPASLDAIMGINVVHVAHDLEATLRELRRCLKPGGRLVIGECVKPDLAQPLYLEFFFTFIRSFTEVQLDPQWRPVHGFLDPECWEKALHHAGFAEVVFVPPPRPLMDQYPTFNATGISARG